MTAIDHLVYACANLDRGCDEIEALLGTRPARGGRHPLYGTHNALLGLGDGMYLEIVSRDPDSAAPPNGAWIDVRDDEPSRLLTWVARPTDFEATAAAGRNCGIGPVQSGQRERPDGSVLRWRLTDPYAMPMQGTVPFLIDWGDATHPSESAPSGGQLAELEIAHPRADEVHRALSVIDADVPVIDGDCCLLRATIETQWGTRTLA